MAMNGRSLVISKIDETWLPHDLILTGVPTNHHHRVWSRIIKLNVADSVSLNLKAAFALGLLSIFEKVIFVPLCPVLLSMLV